MAFFPRHRRHPDVENPFALRYLLQFLVRNWLAWVLVLVVLLALRSLMRANHVTILRKGTLDLAQLQAIPLDPAQLNLDIAGADRVLGPYGPHGELWAILYTERVPAPPPKVQKQPPGPRTIHLANNVVFWNAKENRIVSGFRIPMPEWGQFAFLVVKTSVDGERAVASAMHYPIGWGNEPTLVPEMFFELEPDLPYASACLLLEFDISKGVVAQSRIVEAAVAAQAATPDGAGILVAGNSYNNDGELRIIRWKDGVEQRFPLLGHTARFTADGNIEYESSLGTFLYDMDRKLARRVSDESVKGPIYWAGSQRTNEARGLRIGSNWFDNPASKADPNADPLFYYYLGVATEDSSWFTSSTLPLAFAGKDHLIRYVPGGFEIESLDEVTKPESKRNFDANTMLRRNF